MLGCLAAILVIAGGRLWLASTSSTLSGWTALFFTALCLGLVCFNLLTERPLVSQRQMFSLLLGCISGITALFLLEQNHDSAGGMFLFGAGFLLAVSLFGLRRQNPQFQVFQSQTLANWALRLDDLLKYDLPTGVRNALVQLINALWHSPQDQTDFIPAQNTAFANFLIYLELTIRQGNIEETTKTIDDLAKCLDERNRVLATTIKINYRDVGNEAPQLNHTPVNKRAIRGS